MLCNGTGFDLRIVLLEKEGNAAGGDAAPSSQNPATPHPHTHTHTQPNKPRKQQATKQTRSPWPPSANTSSEATGNAYVLLYQSACVCVCASTSLYTRVPLTDPLLACLFATQQNGTKQSVRELADVLNKVEIDTEQVDVIVAPPALHLDLAQQLLQKNIAVCAQNVSLTGLGAYTGETAAEHLVGTPFFACAFAYLLHLRDVANDISLPLVGLGTCYGQTLVSSGRSRATRSVARTTARATRSWRRRPSARWTTA